ncbi:MAG: 30S ribosomal protein S1 [Firmicutes bacterium]|nr:30S ribosomal protein S1 [Bacillota bacterium]
MLLKPEGFAQVLDSYEALYEAKQKGYPVNAVVSGIDYPAGLPTWVVTFPGLPGPKGLVPSSETGLGDPKLMPRFVGQPVRVIVKGIDRAAGIAACSRREAVAEAEEKLKASLKEGQEVVAVVRAVLPRDDGRPARLLLDIGGGVLAEVPRKEAAVSKSLPLAAQYPPGKQVKVVIKSIDPLAVSVAAGPDPWKAHDFKRGQFLACTVVTVKDGTVFLEPDLAPGMVGIASAPLRGALARGDRVSCAVAAFSADKKKLHLRIRGRA